MSKAQTASINRLKQATLNIVESYNSSEETPLRRLGCRDLPSRETIISILSSLQELFLPGYFGLPGLDESNIGARVDSLVHSLFEDLSSQIELCLLMSTPAKPHSEARREAEEKVLEFIESIPELRFILSLDVKAAFEGDPAARSFDEIIFSYPGVYAVLVYRIAHKLWKLDVPLIPRIMTEHAHTITGIDIHPGAEIGHSFFIDHGTGVVVGETSTIGNNVKLYQGVTLGAISFPKNASGKIIRGAKRHPTIGDNVVIYSGATILGGSTVVGEGSVIGGNVWLTHSIAPHSKVVIEEHNLRITQFLPSSS